MTVFCDRRYLGGHYIFDSFACVNFLTIVNNVKTGIFVELKGKYVTHLIGKAVFCPDFEIANDVLNLDSATGVGCRKGVRNRE